jgi:CBS domain-containing protein
MAVMDIARETVETAGPETSVAELVRRMHEDEVAGLIIVEDSRPLDLVTDRDLTKALLDDQFDAETTPVRQFLDDDLLTIEASMGIYDTVEALSQHGVRRAPVVDESGELAGIISISDIVVLLGMELQQVANAIRSSSPAYQQEGLDYYEMEE